MKHIKGYKMFESWNHTHCENSKIFFESVINMELIEYLKDLSMEYLDDGYKLGYFVTINGRNVLTGSETTDDSNRFRNYIMPTFVNKLEEYKEVYKNMGLLYKFRIYKDEFRNHLDGFDTTDELTGQTFLSGENIIVNNDEANSEILNRIRSQFPSENIIIKE